MDFSGLDDFLTKLEGKASRLEANSFGKLDKMLGALEKKVGVETPEIMASTLLDKVDMYIVEIADRLAKPDKGMFGASGKPAEECIAMLTSLPYVKKYRAELATDIPLSAAVDNAMKKLPIMTASDNLPASLYATYGIQATADPFVNVLLAMAQVIEEIGRCTGQRIINFAKNTASKPGPGKLGTLTFKADVKNLFKFIIDSSSMLEQATVWARFQTIEEIDKKKRYLNLINRLRALGNKAPISDPKIAELEGTARVLKAREEQFAAGTGGGAGGYGYSGSGYRYSGRGGYRKTLKGSRKSRKNLKTRKGSAKKANRKTKSRRHH